jgi:succinate dehydrogenase/fumarate reductase cytochrome b subunit
MIVKKIHRWNAILLAAFIVIHLINHVSGFWGITKYNNVQDALRIVYRNAFIEPILLTSSLVQIVFGGMLIYRGYKRLMKTGWGKVQVISGGLFLFFLAEHLLALVLARWVDGLDTNFYWPASVMSGPPFTWYFIPYYVMGVAAVFTHVGCAMRLAFRRAGREAAGTVVAFAFIVFGFTLGILIVSILLGTYYDIKLPQEWVAYLQRFVSSYTP